MTRIDDIQDSRRTAGDPAARPETARGGAAAAGGGPALVLIGISHRSASLEELERTALDEQGVRHAVHELTGGGAASEVAVVTTCNRSEIYLVARDQARAIERARTLLRTSTAAGPGAFYVKFGRDVTGHLCRVAAGIDSLMVGEVQILGQVKAALQLAMDEKTAGAVLGKLFECAFRAGKRARAETDIGRGAVSVSYAALGLARKIFSDLGDRTLLVVGAGETGALAARHFAETGVGRLLITNRTFPRAEDLAAELGGQALPFQALGVGLGEADIAVTATSSPTPIIDRDLIESARGRRGRRLVLIDIALPRDVDPAVNELEGIFLHDMAALDSIVQRNLERRRREIPRVEAIIAEEVERFRSWRASIEVGPTIRDLRRHFESVRAAELAELRKRLPADEYERLERTTQKLIHKLLHEPQVRLRRPAAEAGDAHSLAAAVRQLFALDGGAATRHQAPAPSSDSELDGDESR